mmetsp:Transcript_10033/g.11144  ORF Transcript_10033/g.11144 Transcript_10033/m.11144 type:complete len:114 (-) Transcript_10033:173-514(-)
MERFHSNNNNGPYMNYQSYNNHHHQYAHYPGSHVHVHVHDHDHEQSGETDCNHPPRTIVSSPPRKESEERKTIVVTAVGKGGQYSCTVDNTNNNDNDNENSPREVSFLNSRSE